MPVTFETDLKDLKEFGYVPQIPIQALFQNLGYKQQRYDQAAQDIQHQLDNLWDIPSYGQDTVRKQQIIDDVNSKLKDFAGKDLGTDQRARADLQALIGQTINSPDLQGIAARGTWYKQLQAKRRELTKDGSSIAPWNDPAQNPEVNAYFSGAVPFDPNKRFDHLDVTKDVDMNEFGKQVNATVPESEWIAKRGMYNDKFKAKGENTLTAAYLERLQNNPAALREQRSKFDYENAGTNWKDVGNREYMATRLSALQNVNMIKQKQSLKPPTTPDEKAMYAAELEDATNAVTELDQQHQYSDPSIRKEKAFKDYLTSLAANHARATMYHNNTEHTLDDVDKMGIQLQNDLKKISAEGDKEIRVNDAKEAAKSGGGAFGSILLDDFMRSLKAPTGSVSGDSKFFTLIAGKKYDASNPLTTKDLAKDLNIPNAESIAGDNSWTPINHVPEVVNKAVGQLSIKTEDGVTIHPANLVTDEKSNRLVFKSADGKTIGYVVNVPNTDGSVTKQFQTMDLDAARTHALIGTSKAAQQAILNYTENDFNNREAVKASKKPAATVVAAPNAAYTNPKDTTNF